MSTILKICKIHGALTLPNQVIKNNGKYFRCRKCVNIWYKRYRARRPELKILNRPENIKSLRCLKCNLDKDLKFFSKSMIKYRYPYCRDCIHIGDKIYYLTAKNKQLLKEYGISLEKYKDMEKSQNFCCAICKQPEKILTKRGTIKSLHLDHCHNTNKIRGLLCNQCNLGIGIFKESIKNLLSAVKYIKYYSK